jgi:hypothetical protein
MIEMVMNMNGKETVIKFGIFSKIYSAFYIKLGVRSVGAALLRIFENYI